MKKNKLTEVTNLTAMNSNEQQNLKGGILFTCEEKRRTVLGVSYTQTVWTVKNDGKLGMTIKM